MEVIYIRIEGSEKQLLLKKAKQLGLSLTAYCRMTLLQVIKESKQ